jgi:hypothetical protein
MMHEQTKGKFSNYIMAQTWERFVVVIILFIVYFVTNGKSYIKVPKNLGNFGENFDLTSYEFDNFVDS